MDMDLPKQQSQKKVVKKSSTSKSAATALYKRKHNISKRDQKKHKAIPDGLEVSYMYKGKTLRKGYTKPGGILCDCCKEVVSPTMFESHAGRSTCKRPYQHIFLSTGVSLDKYISSKLNRVKSVENNDPSMVAKPFDRIACVLCRSYDFNEDGFNDQTAIVCDQCEKEYHIGCLRKDMNLDLQSLPPGKWFCTEDCENVHFFVKMAVCRGPLKAHEYMQPVKKKLKGSDADSITKRDVRWFVLNGKDTCDQRDQYEFLLKDAVDIFHDRFNPIIDPDTKNDIIRSMVYGKQMNAFNFLGVYSVLLTENLKVITAGVFRAFGCEFAELPFVATRQSYQQKGYLQVFLTLFERLLSFIGVKKLVIHAAKHTKLMWIKKFGFKKVSWETRNEIRQTQTSMVVFRGTTLLERDVRQGLSYSKGTSGMGEPVF